MSKTSRHMRNNEMVSKDNNQLPVRNHAKGRLSSTVSNNAKKDEDISIDLQWDF
jgi:hypothetical protein